MSLSKNRMTDIMLALLLPFIACGVQWQFWAIFKPFVWFLFFPTVFFTSRIGGKYVGIISTAISAFLVIYFFINPQLSFTVQNPNNLYSVIVFIFMGVLFSHTHGRLEQANKNAASALEAATLANDRLQKANEQVTRLYEKTVRLDELKTRFFANVSHELRTPLTLILGPAGRCLADPMLGDETRREMEVLERNARTLYRQVGNLLDVAKLEAGEMSLHYSSVDLCGLVRFVASHFEGRASEKSISFRIELPEHLFSQVDQEKFRRILLNLLANAFKFTQNHGEITVILRRRGESAIIEVRDNGPGIPEDKREMIFERFSQIDGGTERRFGGTGLGLAIVKEFAQLQGGNVSVSETPGGGAFFTVTLPLTAPDGAVIHGAEGEIDETFERMIPAGESRQIAGKENVVSSDAPLILVVEDNPDMNRYITSLLGGLYRVVTVFDGAEGLASAQTLRPDLVISDIMMLRMSGERMIQALLDRPEMDNLPIIILSAKADDDLRVRLLKNGVREYLTKPFSDAELLARVAGLLAHQSRTKEELRKSEERLRLALDATSDALWDWDLGSGIIYRSPHYYELTGRQPGEDANDFEFFKSTVQPEDLHRVLKTIEAHKQGKTAAIEFDYRLAAKNGNLKWMRIRGRAVERDASGAPVRIVGTLSDITEHKLAEEEIRELNANLEQRVEERTAELAAANRELDAFAYAVSHDLRAPLRGMSGFSQALIEDYGEQLSGEARIYLEQITIASQRMGELIDGLLILSRGTRGELRRDLLDLSQISERIRDDLIHHEPERQVAWRIEPGMRVRGDARMLKVVMSNLIGNAWKYTAGSLSPLISIYTEEYEGTRRYCVSDNGAGFDMAHASRLFKPFQRLHRQDEFPGIGIGLATVQRIIHRHGGEIIAEGVPGKGATFRFMLAE